MFVKLQGGLGNQMFQAAFGWSTAQKYGQKVYFMKSGLGPGYHRAYGLDAFQGPVEFRNPPFHHFTISESSFAFDPKIYQHTSSCTLFTGNFQTEKYFNEELVRNNFQLAYPLSNGSAQWTDRLRQGVTCSIHVRRTDYTVASTARYHGLCGMDYFSSATQYIKARTNQVRFFIFSDDQNWCHQNFIGPEYTVVGANSFGSGDKGPATEAEDIYLMSLCSHAIIPNSSFGWWGSWLNPDKTRMVVAPKNWFNPDGPAKDFDTNDICPEWWTRL